MFQCSYGGCIKQSEVATGTGTGMEGLVVDPGRVAVMFCLSSCQVVVVSWLGGCRLLAGGGPGVHGAQPLLGRLGHDPGAVRRPLLCGVPGLAQPIQADVPGAHHPFRPSCHTILSKDGEKCYSVATHCDSVQHCRDGSDELDCPVVTRVTTGHAVLIALTCLLLALLLYLIIVVFVQKSLTLHSQKKPNNLTVSQQLCEVKLHSCSHPLSHSRLCLNLSGRRLLKA